MTPTRSERHPAHARLEQILMFKGALSSVALSHRESCPCMVCRAAHGDEEAFAEMWDATQEGSSS